MTIVAIILLALAGCASAPTQEGPDHKAIAETAATKYVSCLIESSEALSFTSARSEEIAIAAQGECSEHFAKYQQAFTDSVTAVATNSNYKWALERAQGKALETKTEQSQKIVAYVVRARANRQEASDNMDTAHKSYTTCLSLQVEKMTSSALSSAAVADAVHRACIPEFERFAGTVETHFLAELPRAKAELVPAAVKDELRASRLRSLEFVQKVVEKKRGRRSSTTSI